MKKFTQWIAAKVIKNHQSVNDLKVRSRYGALEGWASIVINLLLFVVKIVLGFSIKSVSLIADAVHTLADSGTSAVVIIGFKIARKPSDKEHPFGHGRMESVAALVVSVLLFMAGVELVEKSIHAIVKPHSSTAPTGVILVILVTIVIKELMSRFSYQLGEIIDSQALKADALHHRSDVIKEIISEDRRVNAFHDLRIVGCDANRCNVVFDIVLEQDADEQETYDIIRSITEKFKTKFPEMKTVIKAEPKYAYSL